MACLVDETIIERNIDQSINLEELPARFLYDNQPGRKPHKIRLIKNNGIE
jgi:hypothetical protein